jgi:hypothetical protein
MKSMGIPLCLTAWLLAGCIIVPIPTVDHNYCHQEWGDNCSQFRTRGEITKENLQFIVPGLTEKADVLLQLGTPNAVWRDETMFSYEWLMVGGYIFMAIGGGGAPAAIGGSAAWFNTYALVVEFDRKNRVVRFDIQKDGERRSPITSEPLENDHPVSNGERGVMVASVYYGETERGDWRCSCSTQ